MVKLILWRSGLLEKYTIVYNSLHSGSKNKEIDFYFFKKCPKWLLKEEALKFISGKVQTMVSSVVYIETIGKHNFNRQFVY